MHEATGGNPIETGYPSIDKTHLKGEKFFDIHPIIPSMSIYNALNLISSLYFE